MTNNESLICEDLRKSYGGKQVVRGVDIEISKGEIVGLLGPNGAGKTTTFYMIVGLVRPNFGRILLRGEDIADEPMYERSRKGITYLPQEASVFRRLSVKENIMCILQTIPQYKGDKKKAVRKMSELIDSLDLGKVANSKAYSLSGGERRRVEIARALTCDPSFMLLDEPFAGIDPIVVGDLQILVKGLSDMGIGVLITDHNVRETLGICDRAYIMSSGSVMVSGTSEEITSSELAREHYLGKDFKM